jgi:hypothetical protein
MTPDIEWDESEGMPYGAGPRRCCEMSYL